MIRIIISTILLNLFLMNNNFSQTENVDKAVRSFLTEVESKTEKYAGDYYLVNILDYSSFDPSKNGIYKFGIGGAHEKPYLFMYENKKVNVIRDYSVINVLEELISYFSRNESTLSAKDKIKFLENIVPIIKENQFPPGYIKLENDIEDK